MEQVLNSCWLPLGFSEWITGKVGLEAALGEDYKSLPLLGNEAGHIGCQFTGSLDTFVYMTESDLKACACSL